MPRRCVPNKIMLRLGLTGGIASGKSAVAALLRELGFPVLDADSTSHKLMEPGQPAHDEIVKAFGGDIADASGRIDRRNRRPRTSPRTSP